MVNTTTAVTTTATAAFCFPFFFNPHFFTSMPLPSLALRPETPRSRGRQGRRRRWPWHPVLMFIGLVIIMKMLLLPPLI